MNSKTVLGYELQAERLPSGNRKLIRCLKVQELCTPLTDVNVKKPETGGLRGQVRGTAGEIDVFPGFETDFSSIPTPLQFFVRWSRVDVAGVVHDFLYRDTNCPREAADAIWWELARSGDHRASSFRAWVCWLMLRGFGGWSRQSSPEHRVMPFLSAVLVGAVLLVLLPPVTLAVAGLLLLPAAILACVALSVLPVVAIALPVGLVLMRRPNQPHRPGAARSRSAESEEQST